MKDKIIKIIAEQLVVDPETIKETSHLMDDLGMDSLDAIELTMSLERAYRDNWLF